MQICTNSFFDKFGLLFTWPGPGHFQHFFFQKTRKNKLGLKCILSHFRPCLFKKKNQKRIQKKFPPFGWRGGGQTLVWIFLFDGFPYQQLQNFLHYLQSVLKDSTSFTTTSLISMKTSPSHGPVEFTGDCRWQTRSVSFSISASAAASSWSPSAMAQSTGQLDYSVQSSKWQQKIGSQFECGAINLKQ